MTKEELDRVRSSTSDRDNQEIDKKILSTLHFYSTKTKDEITDRIAKLEKEWSIERWLEMNSSVLAFIGVILGAFVSPYWLILSAIVLPFLFLHAIQGWCPPLPVMRKFNVRTRKELDWEKFALKFMRGDFDHPGSYTVEELFRKVKKT